MSTSAYPLHWPEGWRRTRPQDRVRANFSSRQDTGASYRTKRKLTINEGTTRVLDALRKIGVGDWNVIVSTNMPVRGDGLPYSNRREPEDCGAAVYWRTDSGQAYQCIAIDQYDRLADNLAAIGGTLDALRAIERWGGAAILERATAGLKELPSSASNAAGAWWVVLEVDHNANPNDVRAAYQRRRKQTHPDHGGNAAQFSAVQRAWEQYQEARND
ncbi:DnaJ domain-containing protein [Alloalcanivorax sp. C16-1]|uniref:DnaJ domain-containing protein n=1 Tax=Alloalcanivorax sp. C16-1 TaxID=3390051 RepID=UPI003970D833